MSMTNPNHSPIDLLQQQRDMKADMTAERERLVFEAEKKEGRYREIENSCTQEWKLVDDLAHEMLHKSHAYGAGLSRLWDFAWALAVAMSKQSPALSGRLMDWTASLVAQSFQAMRTPEVEPVNDNSSPSMSR